MAEFSAQALDLAAARVSVSEFFDRHGVRWHFVDLCHHGLLLRRIPCRNDEDVEVARRKLFDEMTPWDEEPRDSGSAVCSAAS